MEKIDNGTEIKCTCGPVLVASMNEQEDLIISSQFEKQKKEIKENGKTEENSESNEPNEPENFFSIFRK